MSAAGTRPRRLPKGPKKASQKSATPNDEDIFDAAQSKYENRLVAFLDVLGWKSFIENSAEARALFVASSIAHHFEWNAKWMPGNYKRNDLQVSHFSDTIVISQRFDRRASPGTLILVLHGLLRVAYRFGLPIRGGIAAGKLFHKGRSIFGPALHRAYELEGIAKYPRVVLDKGLEPIFAKVPLMVGGREISFLDWYFEKFEDDFYFMFATHAFSSIRRGFPEEHIVPYCAPDIGTIEELVAAMRRTAKDPGAREKVAWLIRFRDHLLSFLRPKDVVLLRKELQRGERRRKRRAKAARDKAAKDKVRRRRSEARR